MKISDDLESKLPKLRALAHRPLLLIDTHPERLPLLREIFEHYYRQYGIRVFVESQALTAGRPGPERFALTPELAHELQDGALADVREHRAFDRELHSRADAPDSLLSIETLENRTGSGFSAPSRFKSPNDSTL